MSRRRLPEIPKRALRDYAGSEHLAPVWRRLKTELRQEPARVRRSPLLWTWGLALSAALFGSGVLVGARFVRPQVLPGMQAEPSTQHTRSAGAVTAQNAAEPELSTPRPKALPARSRRRVGAGSSASEPLADSFGTVRPSLSGAVPVSPEWQRLVEAGDFSSARRALDQQGGFDVAISHASPSELMSLVDIARASGERLQAMSALRQVLAHPEAPEAPLAAWTLGNLLDQAGDQPGAAQAFALYRRLSPAGDFAEDAAARQVDVALAAGNAELVTQLVADYARDFPHGRRLGEFRRAERALTSGDAGPSAKTEAARDEPEDETDEAQSPEHGASFPGSH